MQVCRFCFGRGHLQGIIVTGPDSSSSPLHRKDIWIGWSQGRWSFRRASNPAERDHPRSPSSRLPCLAFAHPGTVATCELRSPACRSPPRTGFCRVARMSILVSSPVNARQAQKPPTLPRVLPKLSAIPTRFRTFNTYVLDKIDACAVVSTRTDAAKMTSWAYARDRRENLELSVRTSSMYIDNVSCSIGHPPGPSRCTVWKEPLSGWMPVVSTPSPER